MNRIRTYRGSRAGWMVLLAVAMMVVCWSASPVLATSYRTENFVVTAADPQLARDVALAAERYRRELAREWLGQELPAWPQPCPIFVTEGANYGPGGTTRFAFVRGGLPRNWEMRIQGPRHVLIDSVLPHEIAHTVFATYFRQPLPRWVDEGASTLVEHARERAKQEELLIQFFSTGRVIDLEHMFQMRDYPHDLLPLYTQAYSLSKYLVQERGGKHKFVDFVRDGLQQDNWAWAISKHYGYQTLAELQSNWLDWAMPGS